MIGVPMMIAYLMSIRGVSPSLKLYLPSVESTRGLSVDRSTQVIFLHRLQAAGLVLAHDSLAVVECRRT